MNNQNLNIEKNQINKILQIYSQNKIKDALFQANYSKLKYPNLSRIPIFHNLLGLINLRLKDWENSKLNFEDATKLNPNFAEAYYNIGLVYFELGQLEQSYNNLLKAFSLKKNYLRARNKIIELLTFYKPKNINDNGITKVNEEIKQINYRIDFSKKILDESINEYIKKCEQITKENSMDLTYNKNQLFRRKSIFLNCERHKSIFFRNNIIPRFCFGCFKVVINCKNVTDLIKVALIFDQEKFFWNFNRKSMIDKRYDEIKYNSYIYCTNIDEVLDAEIKTKNILNKIVDKNIIVESKRGCSEFSIAYPNYKKIYKNISHLMNYPNEWYLFEKKYDEQNTNEVIKKNNVVNDSVPGESLNNFLIMNNWLNN